MGTNTRSRPSRKASRNRPVPPARPGTLDRGGIDQHEILADLACGGERGALALGLGALVGREVPAAMRCRSVPTVPGASPIVAAEEVCTSRVMPARAAARTPAAAPSTFIRSIGRGSSTHSALTPATLNAWTHPSIPRARRHVVALAADDPGAARLELGGAASERASATTSSPRSSRRRTSALPITPVPPVTNTRAICGYERSAAANWTM